MLDRQSFHLLAKNPPIREDFVLPSSSIYFQTNYIEKIIYPN